MKKLLFTLAAAAIVIIGSSCDLAGLTKGNTSLARKIRQMEKQGYVQVEDQATYTQWNYFVAPTPPYTDGSGQVVMRKNAGGMSLQTEYATISFEGIVAKQGKCTTNIVDITVQTVY